MAPKDKWVLICQNSKASNEKGEEETPQRYVFCTCFDLTPCYRYIETLKGTVTTKKLEELRVCLAGRPVKWIQDFLALDGLKFIFKILEDKLTN